MIGLDNPFALLALLVVLLLLFGAKRLPEIGRSVGARLRGFKESVNGEQSRLEELGPSDDRPASGS